MHKWLQDSEKLNFSSRPLSLSERTFLRSEYGWEPGTNSDSQSIKETEQIPAFAQVFIGFVALKSIDAFLLPGLLLAAKPAALIGVAVFGFKTLRKLQQKKSSD